MADKKFDSQMYHEEQQDSIRAELAETDRLKSEADAKQQQHQAEQQQRALEAEQESLRKSVALVKNTDTRDMLLERIRKMREEKPPEYRPPPLSEADRKRLAEEQEAGRQAVARAQAEVDRLREQREQRERAERIREGEMVPVHHPNPGQDEQFPASKATLGKVKK
jgi:hypothetical protein